MALCWSCSFGHVVGLCAPRPKLSADHAPQQVVNGCVGDVSQVLLSVPI